VKHCETLWRKKIARPTKVSNLVKEKVIQLLTQRKSDKEICDAVGISRTTLFRIKNDDEVVASLKVINKEVLGIEQGRTKKIVQEYQEMLDEIRRISKIGLAIMKKFHDKVLEQEEPEIEKIETVRKFFDKNFWDSPGLEVLLETLSEKENEQLPGISQQDKEGKGSEEKREEQGRSESPVQKNVVPIVPVEIQERPGL
jgi:DNA-directed RNA polymerase subunit H (RpoH/RPB5)